MQNSKVQFKSKKINIKRNEERLIPFIWINGKEVEVSYEAKMNGDNSSIHIVGLFLGTKKNTVIFNTSVIHAAKNTKSRTTIRGVFMNDSSFSNDGLVRINKGAKNADGYFASKILLFDNAMGRSVPSLEIDENELKAGHASTVGKPDVEQLFYMKSRGMSEKQAERLIIEGFFDPILQFLPVNKQKEIKKNIQKAL